MDKSAPERVMASTKGVVHPKESNKEFLSTQVSMDGNVLIPEKRQFQNRIVQIISQEKRPTSLKEYEVIKDLASQDHPMLTSKSSNNSKTCDTEIFLRKDISEEPIDLNPWCKEWSTSCLDEELTLPQIDMQEEFCTGRYTSLQSLPDPRSPSELFTTHQITSEREDTICLPKEAMVLDIEQPILDICNDPHNYFHIKNISNSTMKEANITYMSDSVDILDMPSNTNIWETDILQNSDVMISDMVNSATIYSKHDDQQGTLLNVKSLDKSVMFSPSLTPENDMFLESCIVVDPMETYQTLEHRSSPCEDDTDNVIGMELSDNVIEADEIFIEQQDFSFISNVLSYESTEPLMELANPSTNFYSNDVSSCNNNDNNKRSSNPSLSLKLVTDSSDCSISTPDVIANAISLEGEFNLLSYIEDEQTIHSVSSNVKHESEPESQARNTISKNKPVKASKSTGVRKKYEKRGRPPKLEGTDLKVEFIVGESVNNFKYRELRNKNNEASRRSRMLRKEREMQIMTTLHDLEKHNLNLINSVSHLEDECNKYRKKLLHAMSK